MPLKRLKYCWRFIVRKKSIYYLPALNYLVNHFKSIILNYRKLLGIGALASRALGNHQLDYGLECLKEKLIIFKCQRMRKIIFRVCKQKELIGHLEMFDPRAWHAWKAAHTVLGLLPKLRRKRSFLGS